MNQNQNSRIGAETDTGTGYLRISVRTADGALPLEGALVTIRQSASEDNAGTASGIASFITDRNGQIPTVSLPAPPSELSESPGNLRPYATYNADVSLDGYYTNTYVEIPVFEGITSMQTAVMIPLPENGQPDRAAPDGIRVVETPREDTLNGGGT